MNFTKFMSRVQVLILATLAIFVMASSAWAKTYYIDATRGNDKKSGQSLSTAWKTIAKVNASSFNPGDQILFKRGEVWRETLIAPSCGSSGNPITFGAYGSSNNKPIISGADDLTTSSYKWTPSAKKGTNEYYLEKASGGNPGIIKPLLVWMDQDCLTKGTASSLSDHQWSWGDNDRLGFNTVYIRDDSGDPDISGVLIEAGNRDTILEIGDKSYLNFMDLELRQSDALWGGVVHIYDSYNISFENCIIHDGNYAVFYAYHSDADPPSGITIDSSIIYGCRRTDSPYGAIIKLDGCNNTTIRNSEIYESNDANLADAIFLYNSDNNIIEHNHIYGPAGNLLYIKENSDFNTVRYNKFHDGYMGIQIRVNSNDNKVFYNTIYNMYGGPAIQSDGDVPIHGTKIYNNIIYTTGNNHNGISIHNTNTNCEVKNNLVYVGEHSFALHIHENSKNGVISDYNLLRNVSGALITWAGTPYTMSQFSDYQNTAGQDSHSKTDDPKFVNSENHDFKLQSTSPCINTGTYIDLSEDFEGTSVPQGGKVDIGSFEFKYVEGIIPPKNLRIIMSSS